MQGWRADNYGGHGGYGVMMPPVTHFIAGECDEVMSVMQIKEGPLALGSSSLPHTLHLPHLDQAQAQVQAKVNLLGREKVITSRVR